METFFTGIDHPVIGVRDMEVARTVYEELGFTIPPRGVHPAWGTGNWCIMFEDDYLELRGVVDPAKGIPKMKSFFDTQGEGLMGVALSTSDAERSHNELVKRDLHPKPVSQLTRDFELPEGKVQPRFALCFLEQEETPGLMSVVLCQHLTPELLRRPEWLQHKNGALGVKSMTGLVSDLDAAEEAHLKLFGEEVIRRDQGVVTIAVSADRAIHLTMPDHLSKLHPGLDFLPHHPLPRLVVVKLRTAELTATRKYFSSRDVKLIERPCAVLLRPQVACGVVLEFEE